MTGDEAEVNVDASGGVGAVVAEDNVTDSPADEEEAALADEEAVTPTNMKESSPPAGDDAVSVASTSSDESDGPPPMYEDLAVFPPGKIKYRLDAKENFWWAKYDGLTVNGQPTSGTRLVLISKLQLGDKRRLTHIRADGRFDRLQTHEANIASLLEHKKKGARPSSRERTPPKVSPPASAQPPTESPPAPAQPLASPPPAQPPVASPPPPAQPSNQPPSNAESPSRSSIGDASSVADQMEEDSDAEELFPNVNVANTPPAAAKSNTQQMHNCTPPATIATNLPSLLFNACHRQFYFRPPPQLPTPQRCNCPRRCKLCVHLLPVE